MYTPRILYPYICQWIGCFHVLSIVDKTVINLVSRYLIWHISIPLDKYTEVRLIQQFCFWFLEENSILFPILAVPIYIPINSAWGFTFLYTFTTLISFSFSFFINSHSKWCEETSHCICISLMITDMYLLAICRFHLVFFLVMIIIKRMRENFWRWWIYIRHRLWWWFHVHVLISKYISLYTLNIHRLLLSIIPQ